MKKLIYVLKWYYLDCSSYKIIDVESYTFDDLDKCKEYLKRKAYEIYVDNEGDDVGDGNGGDDDDVGDDAGDDDGDDDVMMVIMLAMMMR